MSDEPNLPVLLSRTLGGLTTELESRDDSTTSLAVWSNVVRCVGDGVSERELAHAARISKRLAVAAVTGCARRGWITASEGKSGRTATLTPVGAHADKQWRVLLSEEDAKWAASPLRGRLEDLVSQLPFELPWFPASYGTADPSAVGGSFVSAKPADDVPAHGQDWRPVHRAQTDTVSSVPLTALLSQALVAFAIDYESRPMWPIASTTLVVRHLRADPKPLADVPGDHGIKGNGKSLLERHGVAVVTKDPGDPRRKLVQLTMRGESIRWQHDAFVRKCEDKWRERFGADVVDGLRAALEAQPYATDSSLPDHVVAPLHLG